MSFLIRSIFIATTFLAADALDNGQFLTPPMGWLSWARFRCELNCKKYPNNCISEKLYMDMADRMAEDGWADVGYKYVNVDDCWEDLAGRDPSSNVLRADPIRFPSGMKALGKYIHSRGLKYGIYSDVGPMTCGGYPASGGHFELDAKTFAEWEVDSLKLDGCYSSQEEYPHQYPEMSKQLNATGRQIGYICSWPAYIGETANLTRIREVCNSWRNYGDIDDNFDSVNDIISWFATQQGKTVPAAGPGTWNDPDMLVIGNYGLSKGQSQIQMALWSIMAAPLMMSNDLRAISAEARAILMNTDVIAVNQDPLGIQGRRVLEITNGRVEIWTRPLENGDLAVAFVRRFNGEPFFPSEVCVPLSKIGWKSDLAHGLDLFSKQSMRFDKEIVVLVEPFGVTMIRLSQNTFDRAR